MWIVSGVVLVLLIMGAFQNCGQFISPPGTVGASSTSENRSSTGDISVLQAPQAMTGMTGSNINLQVVASATSPLRYAWFHDGQIIPDANSSVYTIENAQTTDAGSYSVMIASDKTATILDPVSLTVNSGPTSQANAKKMMVASAADNSCVVPAATQQYISDGLTYFDQGRQTYAVAGSTLCYNNTTTLLNNLRTANWPCAATADVVTYVKACEAWIKNVLSTQPVIVGQPSNVSATIGQPFSVAVSAYGPNTTYQWYLNGAAIAQATRSVYSATASDATAGTYTVVLTNSFGSVTSSEAVVTWTGCPTAVMSVQEDEYFHYVDATLPNGAYNQYVVLPQGGAYICQADHHWKAGAAAGAPVAGAVVTCPAANMSFQEDIMRPVIDVSLPDGTYNQLTIAEGRFLRCLADHQWHKDALPGEPLPGTKITCAAKDFTDMSEIQGTVDINLPNAVLGEIAMSTFRVHVCTANGWQ